MQAPVDFTRVEPLPRSMTVAAINSFVLNSARFLNHFARVAEGKLARADADLSRVELSLSLLESKLASIPGLDGEYVPTNNTATTTADTPTTTTTTTTTTTASDASSTAAPPPPPPPPGSSSLGPSAPVAPAAPSVDAAAEAPVQYDGPMIKDDPRFARFFKMLKLRVDKRNVGMQCEAAGFDSSVLDLDPESPAPPEGAYLVGGIGNGFNRTSEGGSNSDDEEHHDDTSGDAGDPPAASRGDEGASDGEEWDD